MNPPRRRTAFSMWSAIWIAVLLAVAGPARVDAQSAPRVPHLGPARQLTGALGFESPSFSLKGDEIAFVRATAPFGLYRMGLDNPVPVLAIPGIGVGEEWRFGPEGLALDAAPDVWSGRWWMTVDPSGATDMRRGEDQPVWRGVRIRDHQLEVFQHVSFVRWDLPRDHWRDPAISDDGRWVAVVGAEAGLVLLDTWGGPLRYLGPAGRGSFSPGGRWLVFDHLPDGETPARSLQQSSGGESAELIAYETSTDHATSLTSTPDRAERRPDVSPDGHHVTFDAGGAIFVATFEVPHDADDPQPGDVPIPPVPTVRPPSRRIPIVPQHDVRSP